MTDLQSFTLMMASAQVVETSVNTNNSPSQDYTTNPDNHSNHNIYTIYRYIHYIQDDTDMYPSKYGIYTVYRLGIYTIYMTILTRTPLYMAYQWRRSGPNSGGRGGGGGWGGE